MESYPPTLGVTLYSARMFGFRIVALLTLVTTMFHLQNDPAGAAATTRMLTNRRLARQTADGITFVHIILVKITLPRVMDQSQPLKYRKYSVVF